MATPDNKLDTSQPHSARVWNYWLGGKDTFAVDRALGDQIEAVFPDIVDIARQSRRFLGRAVTYLAGEAGIRQFLDIGTGLPSADNTHQVAQRISPSARVVYVDNDPLVLVHARALLTSHPRGLTAYIDADVRDPDAILRGAAQTLDMSQPVGLMMLGILGNVVDYNEARCIVQRLVAALAPGSYLVINDGTNKVNKAARDEATRLSIEAGTPYIARHPDEISGFSPTSSSSSRAWSPPADGGHRRPTSSPLRWMSSAGSVESVPPLVREYRNELSSATRAGARRAPFDGSAIARAADLRGQRTAGV